MLEVRIRHYKSRSNLSNIERFQGGMVYKYYSLANQKYRTIDQNYYFITYSVILERIIINNNLYIIDSVFNLKMV